MPPDGTEDTVVAMVFDRADQHPPPLRLTLELRTDVAGVAGWLCDDLGARHPFSGWLGLVTLLDAVGVRTHPSSD
jgi:hypothetical protein